MKNQTNTFDFNSVGKATPYTVPDDFFAQSKKSLQQIANEVEDREQPLRFRRWWYGIAASVALMGGIAALWQFSFDKQAKNNAVVVYTQGDDKTEDWSAFAEADLFLENMNW